MNDNEPGGEAPTANWLRHGGEMAQRIRQHPWAATSLGPIETWPGSLRTVINMILPSQAQIVLFWGPELLAFYNDAYAPTIGRKHRMAAWTGSTNACWSTPA